MSLVVIHGQVAGVEQHVPLGRRNVAGLEDVDELADAGSHRAGRVGADLLARWLIAPQELPVGVLTAVLGGLYLLWLMHRGGGAIGGRKP